VIVSTQALKTYFVFVSYAAAKGDDLPADRAGGQAPG
jgi:hypothetical protein